MSITRPKQRRVQRTQEAQLRVAGVPEGLEIEIEIKIKMV
jgi:hypothetical protein